MIGLADFFLSVEGGRPWDCEQEQCQGTMLRTSWQSAPSLRVWIVRGNKRSSIVSTMDCMMDSTNLFCNFFNYCHQHLQKSRKPQRQKTEKTPPDYHLYHYYTTLYTRHIHLLAVALTQRLSFTLFSILFTSVYFTAIITTTN